MGIFDMLKQHKDDVAVTRRALDEANDPTADQGAIARMIEQLLQIGVEGKGPYDSASEVAEKALKDTGGNVDEAIDKVLRKHLVQGAAGGFATSVGGFITMPIALPANILEFYVQAARMTAAVAKLRGYDINQPNIRTAILLTISGANADEVLSKAGYATGGGRLATMALKRLPRSAMMMVNKAIGFRLLKSVGQGTLSKLGRGIPVVGGGIGGVLDGYMMNKIGQQALVEFPVYAAPAANEQL